MRLSRRLIPLLAAVLVIQGMVAVVPHHHDSLSAVVDAESGLKTRSSFESSHDCLACSVHAPVVEPSSLDEQMPVISIVGSCSIDGEQHRAARNDGAPSPRGPPWVV